MLNGGKAVNRSFVGPCPDLRFFMILRKKFSDVSLFHMYYRVLNMCLDDGYGFGQVVLFLSLVS